MLLLERGLDCLPAGLTFGERNCIGERHLDLLIGHGFVSLAVLAAKAVVAAAMASTLTTTILLDFMFERSF